MNSILPRPVSQKTAPLRDRKYLDWLRTQPCLLTGHTGGEHLTIDPMHIGTAGRGVKSPDNEALPVVHWLHAEGHQSGEVSMLRHHMPDWLIRAALRAYAREMYAEYLSVERTGDE